MTTAGKNPAPAPTPKPGSNAARPGTGAVKPVTGSAKPVSGPAQPGTAAHPRVSGPLTGRKIGPYRVTDQIGKGGMGVVYRAHDTALDRTVAIKILPTHLSGDEEFVKRFVREARSAARLDHPNIVQVFQAGRMVAEGGGPGPCFIAMQYFDGRPLSELISAEGRLDPPQALEIARQVAEGLVAAHAAGIVHRDIKSSNILVGDGDKVKVTDFGLATCAASEKNRITQTGAYLGTPEYSSPEQCEGAELDGRSDIYSLGVVLYEMLTGRVPFEAATPLKLFERIAHEAPEPISRVQPGLPKELSALVGKMLAKRREDRHAGAEELLSAIRRARAGLGTWRRGAGTASRRPVGTRQLRGAGAQLVAAAAALALLVAAGLGIYFYARGGGKAPAVQPAQPTVPIGPQTPVVTPAPRPAPVTPTPAAEALGVVVFDLASHVDEKDEKRLAWVRAGVPDMLITELKQCPGLAVFTRDRAAEALKSSGGQDQGAAAKRLGARLVVSGSLYAAGGRLRIDLCVADTLTGKVADAVKDEGREEQIFELVNSLGRKLRASFDSLVAAHRGQGQPLAALKVKGAEECLFLAMAAPADGVAGPGRGAGGGGVMFERELAPTASQGQAGGSDPGKGGEGSAGIRRETGKDLAARQQKAGPGYAGALGKAETADSGTDKVKQDRDEASSREAKKLVEQAPAAAAPGAPVAAPPPAPKAPGEPQRTANAAAPAPAPSAAPAKPGAAGDEQVVVGTWKWQPATVFPSDGAAERGPEAEKRAGTITMVATQRAGRIEAMRHYYAGLELLEEAKTRKDFSDALAELALAKSAAPELVAVDEAIKRANQGLDTAPRK